MADRNSKLENQKLTLTDDQIVTERKLPRRSFLTAAGTILAGGAAMLVAGTRAAAQDAAKADDPDAKKASDPDAKKAGDPDAKKSTKKAKKAKKAKKEGMAADPDSKPK